MTTTIHGFCEDRFRPLEDAFRANFEADLELGASLALIHRGKLVVDLWAGYANVKATRPWQEDTIVYVASTTKMMVTIATLMVIDRGLLELDEPIARYWPDFAQGGKEDVTVRDALTHQAGVPGFDTPVPFAALYDWPGITARVAAEPHWFGGRQTICYHAITYGFVLGELIRRVDGRQPAQFFREEIAGKIAADFHMGLTSKSDRARLASTRDLNPAVFADGLCARVMNCIGTGDPTSWETLSADIPASIGFGNGRAIARVCAIMAMGGEIDGVRFLSRSMVEEAATEQAYGQCPVLDWISLGLGFGLHSEFFPAPSPTCFHWGGYGGSWGLMDLNSGISLGYTPNNFTHEITNEKFAIDPRLNRFSVALANVLPEL